MLWLQINEEEEEFAGEVLAHPPSLVVFAPK
jgi:hypothetical protein